MTDIIETLRALGAIKTNGHFLYSSGTHGDAFFNLRVLGKDEHEDLLRNLVYELTSQLLNSVAPISMSQCVFVGPESLGKAMAQIAHEEHLERHNVNIPWLWFKANQTEQGKTYEWGDDCDSSIIAGKTVFWLDDLFNRFSTFQRTRHMLEPAANRIIAGAIVDRGGNTARQWGLHAIISLESVSAQAHNPDSCPLCKSDTPLLDPKTDEVIG